MRIDKHRLIGRVYSNPEKVIFVSKEEGEYVRWYLWAFDLVRQVGQANASKLCRKKK